MPATALRILEEPVPQRPRTRGDCIGGPRPCPWVTCKFHLALDVARDGRLVVLAPLGADGDPDLEAQQARGGTCALDVIDRAELETEEGALSLDAIGRLFGLSRERIRQIEEQALIQCLASRALDALDADAEERAIAARLRAAFAAMLTARRASNAAAVERYAEADGEALGIMGA